MTAEVKGLVERDRRHEEVMAALGELSRRPSAYTPAGVREVVSETLTWLRTLYSDLRGHEVEFERLSQEVEELRRVGAIWRHVKTGGLYEAIGPAAIQTDAPLEDMAPVVIYRAVETGRLWARRWDEFFDGRFEQPTPASPDESYEPCKRGSEGEAERSPNK